MILRGFASRPSLKESVSQTVKKIQGVEKVINQIEVLPLSPRDDDVRADLYTNIYGDTALSRFGSRRATPQFPSIARQGFGITNDPPIGYHAIHIIVKSGHVTLAAIIHKFGVSVDFLRKFRAESVFRCDYKASKLVEPNRGEARAPSGNSSARRGLYICVGAGSQGTVRWDTDGASVMRRAFVRDKTMPGAPRCDEKFPEPGHRF